MPYYQHRYFLIPSTVGFVSDGCETYLTIHNSPNCGVELMAEIKELRFRRRGVMNKTLLDYDDKVFFTAHKFESLGMIDTAHQYWGGANVNASRLIQRMDTAKVGDRLVIEASGRNGYYLVAISKLKIHWAEDKGLYVHISHPSPKGTRHALLAKGNMNLLSYLAAMKLTMISKEKLIDPYKAYDGLDYEWDAEIKDAEEGI